MFIIIIIKHTHMRARTHSHYVNNISSSSSSSSYYYYMGKNADIVNLQIKLRRGGISLGRIEVVMFLRPFCRIITDS